MAWLIAHRHRRLGQFWGVLRLCVLPDRNASVRTTDTSAGYDQSALRVLLIEDEADVARAILRGLTRAGLTAVWASSGHAALILKCSFKPHVVLLDLVLTDMDGRSFVAMLGSPRNCGVIVLSGMLDEADQVIGGDFGADDFMAKPPHMRELVARIRAVHRRVNLLGNQARTPSGRQLEAGA